MLPADDDGLLLLLEALPHLAPLAHQVIVQRTHLGRDQPVVLSQRLLQHVNLRWNKKQDNMLCLTILD